MAYISINGCSRTNINLGISVHDNNEIDTMTLDCPVDVDLSQTRLSTKIVVRSKGALLASFPLTS